MGGDSAAVSGGNIQRTRLSKVFLADERFLIGYTSSFRMGQILQHKLRVQKQLRHGPYKQSDEEFMSTVFIDAVRSCMKDGGYTKIEYSVESGGTFLVGYNGRLYEVSEDFHVNTFIDGYSAIGAGWQYALGSIYTSSITDSPRDIIQVALEAAEEFSTSVCGPFKIMHAKALE